MSEKEKDNDNDKEKEKEKEEGGESMSGDSNDGVTGVTGVTETAGPQALKSEDVADENLTNEEPPTSLETIPSSETPAARNGLQALSKDKAKIDILLKATGNAPIMKQKKWSVNQDNCIGRISDFVRRYLKLDPSERLFLYVNQTFAPAPDQTVKNLYDCYGADGKLILHYCKSQAWG